MTLLMNTVASRIKFLEVCLKSGMDHDAAMKVTEQSNTAILKVVCDCPREISLDTASALIRCISQDMQMFSPECRQALIDSINSKTSRNDMGRSDNIDEQQAAAVPAFAEPAKQSL